MRSGAWGKVFIVLGATLLFLGPILKGPARAQQAPHECDSVLHADLSNLTIKVEDTLSKNALRDWMCAMQNDKVVKQLNDEKREYSQHCHMEFSEADRRLDARAKGTIVGVGG